MAFHAYVEAFLRNLDMELAFRARGEAVVTMASTVYHGFQLHPFHGPLDQLTRCACATCQLQTGGKMPQMPSNEAGDVLISVSFGLYAAYCASERRIFKAFSRVWLQEALQLKEGSACGARRLIVLCGAFYVAPWQVYVGLGSYWAQCFRPPGRFAEVAYSVLHSAWHLLATAATSLAQDFSLQVDRFDLSASA